MNIKSIVIHEIIKKEKETRADIFLSASVLDPNNDEVKNIIKSLDASFAKKTLRRAKFAVDGFKSVINNFKSIQLLKESRTLTEKLKEGIKNISAAKGGYLIFCEYTSSKKFLAVFLVRDTKGALLKHSNNQNWDIKSTEYLNVEHFAMGVRINLDILNSNSEDRYIALAKGSTDVSGYFENWIGVEDTKQEAKDGEALYEIVGKIDFPDGINSRDKLKKQVFDYVSGLPSKIVNLRDLSNYLYGDESTIPNYCDKNYMDIDGEFKLSGKQLSKFFKVSVSAGNIKLEAPRDEFSADGISVSDDGNIVFIRSKALADEIKNNT